MGLLGYFSAVHASPPEAQVNAKTNKAEEMLFMGNLLEMIIENDFLPGFCRAAREDDRKVLGGKSTLSFGRTTP
jgi:hypothetical protein